MLNCCSLWGFRGVQRLGGLDLKYEFFPLLPPSQHLCHYRILNLHRAAILSMPTTLLIRNKIAIFSTSPSSANSSNHIFFDHIPSWYKLFSLPLFLFPSSFVQVLLNNLLWRRITGSPIKSWSFLCFPQALYAPFCFFCCFRGLVILIHVFWWRWLRAFPLQDSSLAPPFSCLCMLLLLLDPLSTLHDLVTAASATPHWPSDLWYIHDPCRCCWTSLFIALMLLICSPSLLTAVCLYHTVKNGGWF